MARLMKAHGYAARTFESATSFLQAEDRAETGCLVADVQMPGMTGLELHARLVAAGEPKPTILITGHPDEAMRLRALEAGVLSYLTKPIDADELLGCVRRALGENQAEGRPQ